MQDNALLASWADGDISAGRLLFSRHADAITGFVVRRVRDEAADIVQRVFLKAIEAVRSGERPEHVRGWLFAIARNEVYDKYRHQKRWAGRFEPDKTSLADIQPRPSVALAGHHNRRVLLAALRQLPVDDQVALELYYWQGLSMAEVGVALGGSQSAAVNRVHRARGRLRDVVASLIDSPDALEDTMSGFDTWADRVKKQ